MTSETPAANVSCMIDRVPNLSSLAPWSPPSLRIAVVVLLVMASVAACSSELDPVASIAGASSTTRAESSSTTTAAATVVTPSDPTSHSTMAEVTTSSVVDTIFAEERLRFLVSVLDDPASATDADLQRQFAPAFLAQIPADDLRGAVADAAGGAAGPWSVVSSELGPLGGAATVASSDGTVLTIVFQLEPSGEQLIVSAELIPFSMADLDGAFTQPGTIDEIDAALDEVAPRVVYGVFDVTNDECAASLERDAGTVVPTGSTFKLWVLATLARAVRDGDASWDETMEVTASLRSSPDGEVYPLADGTPVTLRRLAELMISVSDNTATDHLIARLGRDRIEATMIELGISTATRNTPFLSTAELFKLKFVDPSLGDRYLALDDPEQRRSFLDGEVAATPLPWVADPTWTGEGALGTPRSIDEVEWFATALDICTTFLDLDRLAEQPGLEPVAAILELNPGLPFPATQWRTIRFKGGSEPGVVMFAHWLEAPSGERRVVTVSLTDPDRAFGEMEAVVPVARLLGLVAQEV